MGVSVIFYSPRSKNCTTKIRPTTQTLQLTKVFICFTDPAKNKLAHSDTRVSACDSKDHYFTLNSLYITNINQAVGSELDTLTPPPFAQNTEVKKYPATKNNVACSSGMITGFYRQSQSPYCVRCKRLRLSTFRGTEVGLQPYTVHVILISIRNQVLKNITQFPTHGHSTVDEILDRGAALTKVMLLHKVIKRCISRKQQRLSK